MKRYKEKEERDKAAQKFFDYGKKALYDIVPRESAPDQSTRDLSGNSPEEFDEVNLGKPRIYKRRPKQFWMIVLVVFVLAIAGFYAVSALPTASIELVLEQEPWEFHGTLTTSLNNKEVPLQVFSETKNTQLSFPASGKKRVSRKAHGTLKVCNAFSSDPQPLVATTRFLTPGNILFRLDKNATVPGASIINGKIEPKCIEAEVTADKPGEVYNVGPVQNWAIPGFKGSSKHDGFYGVSEKSMTGGVVGEVSVPTTQDIAKAKEAARAEIKRIVGTAFNVRVLSELIILEYQDAKNSSFTILKEVAIEETDSSGNFQYFIEAKDERLALREDDINRVLLKKAQGEIGDEFELASSKFDMKLVLKTRDTQDTLTGAKVAVNFTGGFTKRLTEDDVKIKAMGKTEAELHKVSLYDGKFSARITLWPFWVKRVPEDKDKITVIVSKEPLDLILGTGETTRATSSDKNEIE